MQRKNVWFPDPVVKGVQKMATAKDRKVTDIIRQAVEKHLEEWEKEEEARRAYEKHLEEWEKEIRAASMMTRSN